MFIIDYKSRVPLYQQIVDNVERLALSGLIAPGGQLPGVRALAVELSINPNTIAKAYAELEARGVIYSLPGRGSFVSDSAEALREAGSLRLSAQARELARQGRRIRLDRDQFRDCCMEAWDAEERGEGE